VGVGWGTKCPHKFDWNTPQRAYEMVVSKRDKNVKPPDLLLKSSKSPLIFIIDLVLNGQD